LLKERFEALLQEVFGTVHIEELGTVLRFVLCCFFIDVRFLLEE
jgi:hypothetical protein